MSSRTKPFPASTRSKGQWLRLSQVREQAGQSQADAAAERQQAHKTSEASLPDFLNDLDLVTALPHEILQQGGLPLQQSAGQGQHHDEGQQQQWATDHHPQQEAPVQRRPGPAALKQQPGA